MRGSRDCSMYTSSRRISFVLRCRWVDRKGEIPEGKKPYFRLPIMNYHKVCGPYIAMYYCSVVAVVLLRLQAVAIAPAVANTVQLLTCSR